MLVQEISPAIPNAQVNLLHLPDCPASPLAALLAPGYTTLRSAEFRLTILVDSCVRNLSAIGEHRKCGDLYVDTDGQIIGAKWHRFMLKGQGCNPAIDGARHAT